jgi:hypothetical protein
MSSTPINEEVDQLLFNQNINMMVEVFVDIADRTAIFVNGSWLQTFKREMLQKFW